MSKIESFVMFYVLSCLAGAAAVIILGTGRAAFAQWTTGQGWQDHHTGIAYKAAVDAVSMFGPAVLYLLMKNSTLAWPTWLLAVVLLGALQVSWSMLAYDRLSRRKKASTAITTVE